MKRGISRALLTFYLPLAVLGIPMLFPLYWLVVSASAVSDAASTASDGVSPVDR